jgi:YidC/Oxa1 family membrane protein insertase
MPIFANVLQPLISVFEWILTTIHDNLGFSWGWSIVAMTIVVRACLLPVAIRQFRSMRAMQRLGPEIKALREKYADDRERLSQETMKLYQQHRVNPAGACLPLVFQLPVFISLFYMLRHDLRYDICPKINLNAAGEKITGGGFPKSCGNIDAAHFLGIPDITAKATGSTLIILLLLYVGTQVVSTLVMAQPNMEPRQRYLMLALPVVFVPFVIGFPAGLLVYWITTNVWTLAQQFTIRETLGRRWDHAHETKLAAAGGDLDLMHKDKKPGFFSNMMSRAQEAQQAGAADGAGSRSRGSSGSSTRPPRGTAASKPAAKPTPSGSDGEASSRRAAAAPPPPPRKKKKRSGRRR